MTTKSIPLKKGKAFLENEWVDCYFITLPLEGLPIINLCYKTWGELLDHKHLVGQESIQLEESSDAN